MVSRPRPITPPTYPSSRLRPLAPASLSEHGGTAPSGVRSGVGSLLASGAWRPSSCPSPCCQRPLSATLSLLLLPFLPPLQPPSSPFMLPLASEPGPRAPTQMGLPPLPGEVIVPWEAEPAPWAGMVFLGMDYGSQLPLKPR